MSAKRGVTPEMLEACLCALEQGQAVEAILARYPAEQAEELAALLRVAQHSRQAAANLQVPLAGRARSRALLLDRAAREALPPSRPRLHLAWGSLAVLLVLLLSLVVTTFASAQALPGQPLYPLKRAAEAVQYNLTTRPEARLALAEALDQRRAQEVQALIRQGQSVEVRFAGFLMQGETGLWEVNRIPLLFSPSQEALARSLEGAYVDVEGVVEPFLGVRVQRLELQLLRVHGTLAEVTPDYLRLDGLTLWLGPATQHRGTLRVGQSVSATVVRLAEDRFLALVVQGQGERAGPTPDFSATPWREFRQSLPKELPTRPAQLPPAQRISPPGQGKSTPQPGPSPRFEATRERTQEAEKSPEPTRTLRPSKTPKPTEEKSEAHETPRPTNPEAGDHEERD